MVILTCHGGMGACTEDTGYIHLQPREVSDAMMDAGSITSILASKVMKGVEFSPRHMNLNNAGIQ